MLENCILMVLVKLKGVMFEDDVNDDRDDVMHLNGNLSTTYTRLPMG